jgi:hypothetical protein
LGNEEGSDVMDQERSVEVERVENVKGWPLAVVGAERLVEDEELGRRLGYADRGIDRLIDRLEAAGQLGEVSRHRVPKPSGGRPEVRRLLTEKQVLKVCLRSETALADKIQDEVIEVFLAVRHGRLQTLAPATEPALLALLQGQQRLAEALAAGVATASSTAKEAAAGAARAEKKADRATEIAERAARDAQHAATLAGSRGVLDTLAASTQPGRAAETPDGAFSRKPKDGYKSMRAVAREYALPRSGEGALLVSRIAEAVGVFEDPDLFDVQAVVIGGRLKNEHRTYAPRALELLDKPLRAAHGVMIGLGFTVTSGGAMVAMRTGTRSRTWVIAQMYDAAIATTGPAPSDAQQSMPFEKAS